MTAIWRKCFNRINPNRSIPTSGYVLSSVVTKIRFNRINPNRSIPTHAKAISMVSILSSFNRINPNRSIPTSDWYNSRFHDTLRFQSYQSKQINPDSYPRGASRGAALRCRMAEPIFERLK